MQRPIKSTTQTLFAIMFILLPSLLLKAETIVLTSVDSPPYEFAVPQDGLRGFDVEVIEAAFNRSQVLTEFKFSPWKRGLEQVKLGIVTGIFSCGFRAEREAFIIYSAPISRQTDGYFVRSNFDDFEPTSLQAAKDLKIATVLGWTQVNTMADVGATVLEYRTVELIFRDLLKGLINYAYLPLEGPIFKAKQLGQSNKFRFIKVLEKDLHICFSKKWPNIEELVKKFNKGLISVQKDGTYKRIHDRYR